MKNDIKKFEFDEVVSIKERQVKNLSVYNIEVEDDHSYCANRIAVHNCITEMSYAMNNGYVLATAAENKKKGKDSYFVFSGGILPTSSKKCISWLGTVVKFVDKPLSDDRIDDPYAEFAIWPGKNNVGRKQADWWICIPSHPQCIHFWEQIDPTTQTWDKDVQKIVWRED